MESLYRFAAAVPKVKVANVNDNAGEILKLTRQARKKNVSLLVFPELSLTGYSCGDLFFQDILLDAVLAALEEIRMDSQSYL